MSEGDAIFEPRQGSMQTQAIGGALAIGGAQLAKIPFQAASLLILPRLLQPIVPDEEPSGVQRVLAVADSGNGVSAVLSWDEWLFINTELTVHFRRPPRGEWICLDAETSIAHGGAGLARSVLSDDDGVVALGAQALLVTPRGA